MTAYAPQEAGAAPRPPGHRPDGPQGTAPHSGSGCAPPEPRCAAMHRCGSHSRRMPVARHPAFISDALHPP